MIEKWVFVVKFSLEQKQKSYKFKFTFLVAEKSFSVRLSVTNMSIALGRNYGRTELSKIDSLFIVYLICQHWLSLLTCLNPGIHEGESNYL